jgi:hypothetical protein
MGGMPFGAECSEGMCVDGDSWMDGYVELLVWVFAGLRGGEVFLCVCVARPHATRTPSAGRDTKGRLAELGVDDGGRT